jgi:hypothetical protein
MQQPSEGNADTEKLHQELILPALPIVETMDVFASEGYMDVFASKGYFDPLDTIRIDYANGIAEGNLLQNHIDELLKANELCEGKIQTKKSTLERLRQQKVALEDELKKDLEEHNEEARTLAQNTSDKIASFNQDVDNTLTKVRERFAEWKKAASFRVENCAAEEKFLQDLMDTCRVKRRRVEEDLKQLNKEEEETVEEIKASVKAAYTYTPLAQISDSDDDIPSDA